MDMNVCIYAVMPPHVGNYKWMLISAKDAVHFVRLYQSKTR